MLNCLQPPLLPFCRTLGVFESHSGNHHFLRMASAPMMFSHDNASLRQYPLIECGLFKRVCCVMMFTVFVDVIDLWIIAEKLETTLPNYKTLTVLCNKQQQQKPF